MGVRLWTDTFVQSGFDLPNDHWAVTYVADMRRDSLCQRREELRQYELESYAAIGGLVVKAIHGGARGCVLNDGGQGGFMGWVTVDFPMYLVGKS